MYANQVQSIFTPWDLTLEFAHLVAMQTVTDGVVQTGAVAQTMQRIVMSPQHAKALARVLEMNIKNYEDQFGPITEIELPLPQRVEPTP